MIRTQISFDEKLYHRAKMVAKRHGISLSELCRRGLNDILAREPQKQKWLQHAGVLALDENASESIDDVVYGREQL